MRKEPDRFRNRADAGRRLAELLHDRPDLENAVVLGLPRGGVPVANAVASSLGLPLDVLIVRKLGVPGYEEVAFGAIASGGIEVLNPDVIRSARITETSIDIVRREQVEELERREILYRGGDRASLQLTGRTVIVVDDGTATGASMRAAVEALSAAEPKRIVVGVGVAPPDVVQQLSVVADDVVSVLTPRNFMAVGAWFDDFTQTTDAEVVALLKAGS
jgi:predicted phosphoribosyltransferase